MQARLRRATPADADRIHELIRALAEYEREPDAVVCTADELRVQLASPRPPFECVLAEIDHAAVGFALFFSNYSTWRGRPGLYLEDLFVVPAHRHRGVGRQLLTHLAGLAVERGCARMEWAVLDWNTPAVDFYRGLGAVPLDEWTVFRLTGEALARLGAPAA